MARRPAYHPPLLMYGVLCGALGVAMYLLGVALALPRQLLGNDPGFLAVNQWIVWYSGIPLVTGMGLCAMDLIVLLGKKRAARVEGRYDPIPAPQLVVALTAYEDEASIADAVRDFRAHPAVREVIV